MLSYTYLSPGKFGLIQKPKPVLRHDRDAIVRVTLITTTIILSIKTCTEALSCDGGCSGSDTCGITCGGVGASCSGHCR